MRKLLRFAILAAFLLGAIPASRSSAAVVPAARETVLPNGLRVIVKPEAGQGIVAINLVICAGSSYEAAGQEGAAHFLEHMLFRGSRHYPSGEAEKYIEGLGGSINAGTLRDFTHIYATLPAGAFEPALAALSDAVLYPTLDSDEIERERAVILSEIARHSEDARTALWDITHAVLFSNHPYGRPINGSKNAVVWLGREDLVVFHHRWYVPNNMVLVIVGDLSEARALAAAKSSFGTLERGPAAQPTGPDSARSAQAPAQVYYHDGSLAYIALAAKVPGIASPRAVYALDVLQALLAQGRSSRLQVLLRESEPIASAVGAEFLTSREPSPFVIWVACAPERVGEVRTKLEQELAGLARGEFTAAEIAAAKRRLETAFWAVNETYSDQADALGFYEALDSYRSADDYVPHIRAVTPAEVRDAVRAYLTEKNTVWLTLLPRPGKRAAADEGE